MKVLIPIDFTGVTENALHFALQLPNVTEAVAFHVVNQDKDTVDAQVKLEELASRYAKEFKGQISTSVKTGNIFDHIGEEAFNLQCDLIVMGTHGVKGLQHLIGSKAMRVITNSKTPYIVVQKKPFNKLRDFLIPVDFTRESKQVLPFLVSLAKNFNARLLLLKQSTGKDEFIKNKIENNLSYFKSVLDDNGCEYQLLDSEFSYDKKYQSILKVATAVEADMIVTAIDPKIDVADYIMGVEEQKIVANEAQIPVLCINIRHFTKFTGSIFEGSA